MRDRTLTLVTPGLFRLLAGRLLSAAGSIPGVTRRLLETPH